MDKKKKNLIIGVVIYLISALLSYFTFTILFGGSSLITPIPEPTKEGDRTVFDDSLPKTEPCPLNGVLWSEQQRNWWEEHRPLGIMVENHEESRPQSGLSYADIMYEAVAEGGITRFLAIFHCQDAGIVGPVRSARTYFLDFISEYGDYPLYAHVGGANTPGPADALGQISEYGWSVYNDLNQFSIGFPAFWRDYERLGRTVATEHTVYTTTENLWEVAAERDLTNEDEDGNEWDEEFEPYTFKDDEPSGGNQTITFNFWEGYGAYEVVWIYDSATNTYKRENGGEPHLDRNNDEQFSAKNVVHLYMTERNANDGYPGNLHLLYGTTGTGEATVFMDGEEIEATWSKPSRTDRLILSDSTGDEIEFNRGVIWYQVLPVGTSVVVN